jgi:hypothetical protein
MGYTFLANWSKRVLPWYAACLPPFQRFSQTGKIMRRLFASFAVGGLLLAQPQAVNAQTNINYNAQFGPSSTVLYLPFYVSTPGAFSIFTSGLNHIDPMIWLFAGTGLSTPIGVNDDGAFTSAQPGWNICTGTPNGSCNSLINIGLAPGDYTVAMSVYNFTLAEAQSGSSNFNNDPPPYPDYCNDGGNWASCSYTLTINSADGVATVTPEPASLVLLGTGVVGLGGMIRRRRQARLA